MPAPPPPDNRDDADRLAHAVRTPLTVIHAQAELLQRVVRRMDGASDGDRERLEVGLGRILGASRRLASLVEPDAARGGPKPH